MQINVACLTFLGDISRTDVICGEKRSQYTNSFSWLHQEGNQQYWGLFDDVTGNVLFI